MKSYFKNLFFKTIAFLLAKADHHTIDYYKYSSQERVKFGSNVRFRHNSSIVFLDGNRSSRVIFGNNCEVRQFCVFTVFETGKIFVDDDCFFNNGCTITSLGEVRIGKNCLFGEGIRIYDHNHNYKSSMAIREQGFSTGKVTIGNNCWFGSNCIILNNVTIGDNVVVGANTLIYKSIESNSVVRSSQGVLSSVYR